MAGAQQPFGMAGVAPSATTREGVAGAQSSAMTGGVSRSPPSGMVAESAVCPRTTLHPIHPIYPNPLNPNPTQPTLALQACMGESAAGSGMAGAHSPSPAHQPFGMAGVAGMFASQGSGAGSGAFASSRNARTGEQGRELGASHHARTLEPSEGGGGAAYDPSNGAAVSLNGAPVPHQAPPYTQPQGTNLNVQINSALLLFCTT